MPDINPFEVEDGGAVRVLRSGLVILRRRRHEWSPRLAKLDENELAIRTDKRFGSKFVQAWDRARLIDWVESEVERAGWE